MNLNSLIKYIDVYIKLAAFEPPPDAFEQCKLAYRSAVANHYLEQAELIKPYLTQEYYQQYLGHVDNLSNELNSFVYWFEKEVSKVFKEIVDKIKVLQPGEHIEIASAQTAVQKLTDICMKYKLPMATEFNECVDEINSSLNLEYWLTPNGQVELNPGGVYEIDELAVISHYPTEYGIGQIHKYIKELEPYSVDLDDLVILFNYVVNMLQQAVSSKYSDAKINENILIDPSMKGWKYENKVWNSNVDFVFKVTTEPYIDEGSSTSAEGWYSPSSNVIFVFIEPEALEPSLKSYLGTAFQFNVIDEWLLRAKSNIIRIPQSTIYHELTHYSQLLFDSPNHIVGLPKLKEKSKYDSHGFYEGKRTESHVFRDIEAYPRLNDSIFDFKIYLENKSRFYSYIPLKTHIRNFLGIDGIVPRDTNYNFQQLLTAPTEIGGEIPKQPDYNRKRYRQMVKVFLKYLDQHPEIIEENWKPSK